MVLNFHVFIENEVVFRHDQRCVYNINIEQIYDIL